MTRQEDKQLLLADLCGRLPYGVKVKCPSDDEPYTLLSINWNKEIVVIGFMMDEMYVTSKQKLVDIKPYLRPMSSMTEEEKNELVNLCTMGNVSVNTDWESFGINIIDTHLRFGDSFCTDYSAIDWLNKKMFDYRGLISKGLAISTEEFNPYND